MVSTIKSNPPMASDDIRRAADHLLDLTDLRGLGRPAAPRRKKRAAGRYEYADDSRISERLSAGSAARLPLCPAARGLSRKPTLRVEPSWFNGAAPSFGDAQARLLVVGLAPGRTAQSNRAALYRRLRAATFSMAR